MPQNDDDFDFAIEQKQDDNKPITQFFAFLDNTASLFKSILTRYIRISDNAWRAFIGLLFILILWLSGDLQKLIFLGLIVVLAILIFIDVAIDNWGKIFRTFRREKTFDEINVSTPTAIVAMLLHYNVVGDDMLSLLSFLKSKNWVSARMVDTLLVQQHLDDFAVNELLTANISKKDVSRILWQYNNSANENTILEVLKKWDYSEDLLKVCLKRQISSIEVIRKAKEIPRKEFAHIEALCPLKGIHSHWLLKAFRLVIVLFTIITSYLLFSTQHSSTISALASFQNISGDALTSVFFTTTAIAIIASALIWFILYILLIPVLRFIYHIARDFQFESAYKEAFGE